MGRTGGDDAWTLLGHCEDMKAAWQGGLVAMERLGTRGEGVDRESGCHEHVTF